VARVCACCLQACGAGCMRLWQGRGAAAVAVELVVCRPAAARCLVRQAAPRCVLSVAGPQRRGGSVQRVTRGLMGTPCVLHPWLHCVLTSVAGVLCCAARHTRMCSRSRACRAAVCASRSSTPASVLRCGASLVLPCVGQFQAAGRASGPHSLSAVGPCPRPARSACPVRDDCWPNVRLVMMGVMCAAADTLSCRGCARAMWFMGPQCVTARAAAGDFMQVLEQACLGRRS
jgi:hypothetical protein